MKKFDVAIIGGGASGLAAAIAAARAGASVGLFERNRATGKKLSLTGNGKCNITNANCARNNWDILKNAYFSDNADFVKTVIDEFDAADALDFFSGIGLFTKLKGGLYFPLSEQASAVSDILRLACEECGVEIHTDYMVNEVSVSDGTDRFEINGGEFAAKSLVIAAGGSAFPKSGSDGSGFSLAKSFGHTIVPTGPALTGLKCIGANFHDMGGVRTDAKLSLIVDGKLEREESGNLQITEWGLSGIPAFQLSRHAVMALADDKKVQMRIDFLPEQSAEGLESALRRMASSSPDRTILQHLLGLFCKKLAQAVIFGCGFKADRRLGGKDVGPIADKIKNFTVDVTEPNGFDNAQVTCGGVDTREIDPVTMGSRLIPGLYFSGEVIDTDGICGGYNLQFAWSTGCLAGANAAKNIKIDQERSNRRT